EGVGPADLGDETGGMPRGPARESRPFQDDDIGDPELGQVVGHRRAGDAGADHDDPGATRWFGEWLEDRAIELAVREALRSGHVREHGAPTGVHVNLLR